MWAQYNVRKYFNQRLALSCSLIALSSFNYAFDNQGFAQTQAMDAFTKKFGVYSSVTDSWTLDTQWKSYFNGLPYLTFACGMICWDNLSVTANQASGVIIGSIISAQFGRRWCMFTMSIYALATATIVTTSQTKEQILASRILNCGSAKHARWTDLTSLDIYIGMELSVVPVFQSEIAPTKVRGFMVGTYQLTIAVSNGCQF